VRRQRSEPEPREEMRAYQSTIMPWLSANSIGSQASLYQQLRGHRSALKLTAAGQHLPSLLATADAEGWSATQALDRLLAREVEATEARKLTGRFRFRLIADPSDTGGLRPRRGPRRRQETRRWAHGHAVTASDPQNVRGADPRNRAPPASQGPDRSRRVKARAPRRGSSAARPAGSTRSPRGRSGPRPLPLPPRRRRSAPHGSAGLSRGRVRR
jgi:hypothetical protein